MSLSARAALVIPSTTSYDRFVKAMLLHTDAQLNVRSIKFKSSVLGQMPWLPIFTRFLLAELSRVSRGLPTAAISRARASVLLPGAAYL